MRGSPLSFQFVLAGILLSTAACGGAGGGGGGIQPPPPQPDFTITVSAASVDVSQGSTSNPVNIVVNPQNGFTSGVCVSFSGLPSGVTTNPSVPLIITPGSAVSVLFGAAPDASAGQFSMTARGSSGSLAHSSAFTLDIHLTVPINLPRSTFVPNDSVASPPAWSSPRTRKRSTSTSLSAIPTWLPLFRVATCNR
jgi:hypothetical protein